MRSSYPGGVNPASRSTHNSLRLDFISDGGGVMRSSYPGGVNPALDFLRNISRHIHQDIFPAIKPTFCHSVRIPFL